jgi:hypothetical protein
MGIGRGLVTSRLTFALVAVLVLAHPAMLSAVEPLKSPPLLTKIPILSAVAVNPATVIGGTQQVAASVTLLQPAPASGATVTLQSSNPGVVAVPASVVVQPGATSATFVVLTRPVATNPNVVPGTVSVAVSGRIGGAPPKTAILTVLPPALLSLTLDPASVTGGVGSAGSVTISGPAPAGGYVITLSSQNQAATVPSSVTVLAGANSATFPVTTRSVSTPTAGAIIAARGVFSTKTAMLTVQPPGVASVTLSNSFINNQYPTDGGYPINGEVKLTAPAPPGGATVQLHVTPTHATTPTYPCFPSPTFPATLQIPAGGTKKSFTIGTSAGSTSFTWAGNVPYTETANFDFHASFGGTTASKQTSIRTNRVVSLSVASASVKGGSSVQGTATLMDEAPPLPASCANVVRLASSNPLVAQVPATVAIPTGQKQIIFPITTSSVPQPIQVTILAYPSYGSGGNGAKEVTLTVKPN